MLVIIFNINNELFGIDSLYIKEIIPYIKPKNILYAPEFVLGEIIYQEEAIPLIDLNMLFLGQTTNKYYSSRIAILRLLNEQNSKKIAVLGNKMTETININEVDNITNTPPLLNNHFLGPVFRYDNKRIQIFDVSKLLVEDDCIQCLQKEFYHKFGEKK